MHPYLMLKEILSEMGAQLTSEVSHPHVFGSYIATYAGLTSPIRLVWDGKEGWGFVQRCRSENDWVDATDFLTKMDLESLPQNALKIEKFRQIVATLLR